MKPEDAEPLFRQMLTDAGFDFAAPSPSVAWQVFKTFAENPVDCAGDGLLFECGVYSFTGEPLFHFGFCRQFEIEEDGEYDHMEQLHCRFTCQPTEELQLLESNLWAEGFNSLERYFEAVESLPEFQTGIKHATTWQCEVEQHEV